MSYEPMTKTPLAHLDVDKVADMLIAAYDLELDSSGENIIERNHTCNKELWNVDLRDYLPTGGVEINTIDSYNTDWLDALHITVCLKLAIKAGGHSEYNLNKEEMFNRFKLLHEGEELSVSEKLDLWEDYYDFAVEKGAGIISYADFRERYVIGNTDNAE